MDGIKEATHKGELHVSRPAVDTLFVRLSGSWTLQSKVPTAMELRRQLEAESGVRRLVVEARALTGWDSGLVTFLRNVAGVCAQRQIALQREGLPEGVRRLLDLAAVGDVHRLQPAPDPRHRRAEAGPGRAVRL